MRQQRPPSIDEGNLGESNLTVMHYPALSYYRVVLETQIGRIVKSLSYNSNNALLPLGNNSQVGSEIAVPMKL